jgi:hypothetical protein
MSKYKTKKEWEAAADKLFADGMSPQEINKTVGTYSGPEGTFTIQQAQKSKRGFTVVDKDKRGKRNQKRIDMERSQSMGVGDTVEPPSTTDSKLRNKLGAGKGTEIHHRISLIQNTPFLDGLSEEDQRKFVTWADSQGWDLGNREGNPDILVTKPEHTSEHAWMRENQIEGARGPQKRLTERFKGMSLEERKSVFRDYMNYVQGGVDERLAESLGDRAFSQKHAAAQARNAKIVEQQTEVARLRSNVGTIQSGPQAGERLPINRRTIGDAIIAEQRGTGPSLELNNGSLRFKRSQMKALAGAGLAGFSALGTAASAAETVGRGQIATETGNPLDYVQAGLSGASLAADFVPAVGELVSTPADALNVAIDTIRDPKSLAEGAMNRRQQERKEKLQSKPADAPERRQSLSVGFAEGGF